MCKKISFDVSIGKSELSEDSFFKFCSEPDINLPVNIFGGFYIISLGLFVLDGTGRFRVDLRRSMHGNVCGISRESGEECS